MLLEFPQTVRDGQIPPGPALTQPIVPKIEPQCGQSPAHALVLTGREEARQHGVARVERDADGHGVPVADGMSCHHLELMRRPVAEIERTTRSGLEWIAASRDLAKVENGRP